MVKISIGKRVFLTLINLRVLLQTIKITITKILTSNCNEKVNKIDIEIFFIVLFNCKLITLAPWTIDNIEP